MSKKYVYLFSEGNADMRELLGGKGANLAEMTNIGLPVPQGFTITTEACTRYYEDGKQLAPDILDEIMKYVAKLEKMTGKKFGDVTNPLLVSVRSGARASMGLTFIRQLVNIAALAIVFFMRNIVPLPFIATIIGTAVGLTVVSFFFVWRISKKSAQ